MPFFAGKYLPFTNEDALPIYIATNANNLYGSCCLLYENALEIFAEMIGRNYYILPSSLHEILLVPEDDDANAAVLTAMVQDVNITSLCPDEILSNHIYYYDQSRKKLIVCTKRT